MINPSFPQWTTKITEGKDVVGEDMLGLEGAAQSFQQWLIPGIISTTDHARYFSFYAWVLYRYINSLSNNRTLDGLKKGFYKRHEMALILGAYSHHKQNGHLRGLVGAGINDIKVASWWDAKDPVSLNTKYFTHKLGGLGQYYLTVMQELGIVGEQEFSSWVYPLTHRGEALAQAYAASISKTTYYKKLEENGELKDISHKDAANFGKKGCICAGALSEGVDLELLRDAFFRFDQHGEDNPHFRRRLALSVTLDLVRGAKGRFEPYMLRPALYLGEYYPNAKYQPSPELEAWAFRWKMIAVRQHYTFGLQTLWGAFILQLRESKEGISLPEFMAWVKKTIDPKIFNAPLEAYLNSVCKSVGLRLDWQKSHKDFGDACLQKTEKDEYSIFLYANRIPTDPEVLLTVGLQTLISHYLRFLHLHQTPRQEWKEMAERERLSITSFYDFMGERLSAGSSLGFWLEKLYKEFILSQHEFIALGKLRYQKYDTFKFHYRDGRFYWPFRRVDHWREPIRLAGNRLERALSILLDLNLVEENEDRQYSLTKDGKKYLEQVLEMSRHDN